MSGDEERERTNLITVTTGSTEPFGEKNIDSTTIEPNSATEHAATTNVPAVRVEHPGVLEHRHDDAERCRREDDADEQRVDDDVERAERERQRQTDQQ